MDYPFLFVNHGPPDPDCIDKCEEIFLWFMRDVTPKERKAIEAGCPSPLSCFWHWDRRFCYFGSQGDTYDSAITYDYAPESVREALNADPRKNAKAWQKAYQQAMSRMDEATEAFAEDLERWAREVHAIVPIAVLWGPNGAPEDDPWHRYSAERFADVMYERLRTYQPDGAKGKKHLSWIRNLCSDLLIAPRKKGSRGGPDAPEDARAIEVIDAAARERRPKCYVSRLSYPENDVLTVAAQVGKFIGNGNGWKERLSRLAPLSRLVYLASYDAGKRVDAEADLLAMLRPIVDALGEDERSSAAPLLVMLAQAIVRDTPAFDRPRKKLADRAIEVLRLALAQPKPNAGTWARLSRYLRWARRLEEARGAVEEGILRHGDRPVLLRAGVRAARAMRDAAAEDAYMTRLRDAVTASADCSGGQGSGSVTEVS